MRDWTLTNKPDRNTTSVSIQCY